MKYLNFNIDYMLKEYFRYIKLKGIIKIDLFFILP